MAVYLKEREIFRGFSLMHSGGIPILNARTRFQEESGLQVPTGTNSSTGQMHQYLSAWPGTCKGKLVVYKTVLAVLVDASLGMVCIN